MMMVMMMMMMMMMVVVVVVMIVMAMIMMMPSCSSADLYATLVGSAPDQEGVNHKCYKKTLWDASVPCYKNTMQKARQRRT
jgi:hypothetical protein